jgi:ABC-type sugar transport system ATPase subunit
LASVTLKGIHKSFDDTKVIKGVDLEIADGEFLVLVGPSGCGKSTLMRLVAGLEDLTAGDLYIGEARVNDVEPRDRGVAMVFQSYALYPHMTVRENMAFGLKIRKTPKDVIDKRVEEVGHMLDLTPYLERFPRQLSGGQRQRVAMGRAIVRQPDVFLFDEPLSNLDAALRTQMRVELKKLHHRLRTTMIYVTHDQIEAMTLADRIAVLRDGYLEQVGTPAELFDTPRNRFVASFIGSPGMNFLPGKVEAEAFTGGGFRLPLGERVGGATPKECGIRPQHLEVLPWEASPAPGQAVLEAILDVTEPMGWEAYAHVRIGDFPAVAHVRAEDVRGFKSGDKIRFAVEEGRVNYFDEAGLRI